MDFLFKKNLWVLDLITVISFSLFFGYKLLKDSLTGEPKWTQILYGTLAYLFTFILAISLQNKIPWLRSWAWLGIIGALIRIIFLQIMHFPKQWEYYQKFSANNLEAVSKISSDILKAVAFNWLFWAVIGLICIFVVRFLAYIFFYAFNASNLQRGNNVKN